MTVRRATRPGALLLAGLASLPAFAGAPAAEDWLIERHEVSVPVAEAARIEIDNPFGDVRVRPAPGSSIEILGLEQRHREDRGRPEVVVRQARGTVRVEVTYPEVAPGADEPAEWRRRRVDVSLLVPADLPLAITTVGGLIEVRKTRGDLFLRSVGGEIVTLGWGTVDAESDRGDLRIDLLTTSWRTPPRLRTENGDIIVVLPRSARARARLATRGEISTDFSLDIERDPESGHKTALAQIGGEGMELTATSVNGTIKLLQSRLRDP